MKSVNTIIILMKLIITFAQKIVRVLMIKLLMKRKNVSTIVKKIIFINMNLIKYATKNALMELFIMKMKVFALKKKSL